MPKVKLSRFAEKEAPPIDWMWAAVLERKAVKGLDVKELAKIAEVSYETMRQYIRKSPWDWPRAPREKVCRALGLVVKVDNDGFHLEVKS